MNTAAPTQQDTNACDLKGVVFTAADGVFRGKPSGKRWITATHNGRTVGHLGWHTNSARAPHGEIISIEVPETMRRKGIATAMFAAALLDTPTLHHSPALSPDAEAWIEAMSRAA